MNFRPRAKEEPEINLIPFIDVLLVVLIFLMLSTTYSKFTELQLRLPVADADAQRDYPKEVVVGVAADGRYTVNKVPVNGRSPEVLAGALKEVCPNGIDGYFDNVGGMVLDAVMLRSNPRARVAVCGMIAGYNGEPIPMAAPQLILVNRMRFEGFIVSEHMEVWPQALKELSTLVATGKLKYRETIADGIASAPEAFLGLLKGKNFGKQLVKLI